jgi:hypothetical protein
MPFFRNFFRLHNLVVRLRVGMATEPTLDLGTLRRIQRSTNLQDLAGEVSDLDLARSGCTRTVRGSVRVQSSCYEFLYFVPSWPV